MEYRAGSPGTQRKSGKNQVTVGRELTRALVGEEALWMAEAETAGDAVTAEEVAGMIAACGRPAGEVRTAAAVAAELAEVFADRLAWWEGDRR